MPELGTYGSVRGAVGNNRPYRERRPPSAWIGSHRAVIRNPAHALPLQLRRRHDRCFPDSCRLALGLGSLVNFRALSG